MSAASRERCTSSRARARGERCRTTGEREPLRFVSFSLPELLRLRRQDFDELDALAGDEERERTWWRVRRWGWAVQDQEARYGRS